MILHSHTHTHTYIDYIPTHLTMSVFYKKNNFYYYYYHLCPITHRRSRRLTFVQYTLGSYPVTLTIEHRAIRLLYNYLIIYN